MISRSEDRIRQFVRNNRWGTCASCPRLGDGSTAPELCEFTERNDHQLSLDSLVSPIMSEVQE